MTENKSQIQQILDAAILLDENQKIKIPFDNARRMASVRSGLYRLKEVGGELYKDVQIKKSGNILYVYKAIESDMQLQFSVVSNDKDESVDADCDDETLNNDCTELKKKVSDYNVIGGVRANKINDAMKTMFSADVRKITQETKDALEMIGLEDCSEEEKQEKKQEVRDAANLKLEEINRKRREAVLNGSIL